MAKILRITTVPISLNILLKGQFIFMKSQGYEVVAVSADGPEVQELVDREEVRHIKVPFTRVINPFNDLICLWKTIRLIKKERPDIVHTHTPKAGLIGMMAAKLMGVKCRLHTVAGMPLMEASGVTKMLLRYTEKLTYRCASEVFPNSLKLQKWMIESFPSYQHKFRIIGSGSSNGIDTNHFKKTNSIDNEATKIREQLGIKPEAEVLIFVGRLVKGKGVEELVKAFDQLNKPEVHLILVGQYEDQREPLSSEIKSLIASYHNIHHVGFKNDIRPYLAAADIFVFPSYREGFPNVVLQACSMGLPCIVSDINGNSEIIQQEVNGLLVPAKNKEVLLQAVKELVYDVDLRARFALNARKSVLPFEQKKIWQLLLQEYQKAQLAL